MENYGNAQIRLILYHDQVFVVNDGNLWKNGACLPVEFKVYNSTSRSCQGLVGLKPQRHGLGFYNIFGTRSHQKMTQDPSIGKDFSNNLKAKLKGPSAIFSLWPRALMDHSPSSYLDFFCFILLTNKVLHWEMYWNFYPRLTSTAGGSLGCLYATGSVYPEPTLPNC